MNLIIIRSFTFGSLFNIGRDFPESFEHINGVFTSNDVFVSLPTHQPFRKKLLLLSNYNYNITKENIYYTGKNILCMHGIQINLFTSYDEWLIDDETIFKLQLMFNDNGYIKL